MITQQEACEQVLARFTDEPGAIASCTLAPRGDYWVIVANTAACVLDGDESQCLIGVNAYLVHIATGRMEFAYSYETWQTRIQDLYDLDDALGSHYVLRPDCAPGDLRSIIRLRQRLDCSPDEARWLLTGAHRGWLFGTRSALLEAQKLLAPHGVATKLELQDDPQPAVMLVTQDWTLEHVLGRLRERLAMRERES